MSHMYAQEEGHLNTFNHLMAKHRVRPTALYPLWSVLATGLGWSTAVMGREAAMACTEAVETEIGTHYNDQIRKLLEMFEQWEAEGYEVGDEFRELVNTLRRIRDEELEHLDHAVEHDAKKAEPHWLLTGVIRAGCRGAIWCQQPSTEPRSTGAPLAASVSTAFTGIQGGLFWAATRAPGKYGYGSDGMSHVTKLENRQAS
ncbi:hypothetical protein DL771_007466 [Monosporascus sp. 5C6A]|nr:hypothetical protein DL771_007466 [Monosporascus sp. 5C6A]